MKATSCVEKQNKTMKSMEILTEPRDNFIKVEPQCIHKNKKL